jgi:RNA polymerase sigma factor (sigma-70 family)
VPRRLLALASDDRLVEQIRRGNAAAFEVAYERHSAAILSFCRHMLGSREEAEDAVQHTFAAAHSSLLADERDIRLKPWLYAIARNRCLSLLRGRREEAAEDLELETAGLHDEVEQRAELRELLADLRDLPAEQRAALLMAELSDLPHSDIAGVLDCEVERVKALVFRARSGLIQRRDARATSCADVREQLANLHGGSLRRGELKHHLRVCEGCRDYREQVRRQRQLLAAVLPVMPSAGLKAGVLGALGIGGGSAGGAAGGGLAAVGGSSALAKLAVAGVVLGGGAVAGSVALDRSDAGGDRPARAGTPSAETRQAGSAGEPAAARALAPAAPAARKRAAARRRARRHAGTRRSPAAVPVVVRAERKTPPGQARAGGGNGSANAHRVKVKKPKKVKPQKPAHVRPPKAQGPPVVAPPPARPEKSPSTDEPKKNEAQDQQEE